MKQWYIIAVLITSALILPRFAWSETTDISTEPAQQIILPIHFIQQIEADYPGTPVEFESDIEGDKLLYEVAMIDLEQTMVTEYQFNASDGQLIQQQSASIEPEDSDELQALSLMKERELLFSQLIIMAMKEQQGELVEAQLDHDLGISYLELKIRDNNSVRKLAYDIEHLRLLPLLTLD